MKLSEAIKVGKAYQKNPCPAMTPAQLKAHQLGIEALKWRQLLEHDYGLWCGPPLPGETKD